MRRRDCLTLNALPADDVILPSSLLMSPAEDDVESTEPAP